MPYCIQCDHPLTWIYRHEQRIREAERARIAAALQADTTWMCVCDQQCRPEDYCSARIGIIDLITSEADS